MSLSLLYMYKMRVKIYLTHFVLCTPYEFGVYTNCRIKEKRFIYRFGNNKFLKESVLPPTHLIAILPPRHIPARPVRVVRYLFYSPCIWHLFLYLREANDMKSIFKLVMMLYFNIHSYQWVKKTTLMRFLL